MKVFVNKDNITDKKLWRDNLRERLFNDRKYQTKELQAMANMQFYEVDSAIKAYYRNLER